MAPSVPAKVRIIAIALWSAGADATEHAQQCPSFEAEMPNTDVSAGSLVASHWAASIDDCCQLCDEASQNGTACDGFAYAHSVCYLKADFQGTYYNWGVVSRLRTSSTACSGFTSAQQDTDLDGDLLEEWYSPDPALCCASCGRKPECQGYVYLVDTCYLKGNVRGTYSTAGAIARVKEGVLTEEEAVVTTAPPPQCHHFEADMPDTDVSAGSLVASHWASSIDDCCQLCDETSRNGTACDGFAYAYSVCYLKADFQGTHYNWGVVSRLRTSSTACSGFTSAQQDTDLDGDLLEEWYSPDPALCCASCGQKPQCQGYVYLVDTCYLKGNVQGTYSTEGAIARVKEGVLTEEGAVVTTAPPPQCHLFEPTALDWDIVGDTLAETWAATSDGCCSACGEMPGCEGFAYSNQWNTCYLKGNFTGLSHNPGVVSRIKSSLAGNCSGFQAAREGQDLAGRTVIDFPSPNPQVCCLVCSRKEDCQGFASFEDRCYLKADVSGTFEKQNCQVILKEGILSEAGGERRLSQVPLMV